MATVAPPAETDVAGYPHGRVPRAVREGQVLAAAERLFAEQGFAGASMDELSRRVGVSKPVVYDLFGSKEALYRRCVDRLATALAECVATSVASETEPRRQLQAGTLAFFRFVAERRRLWEALAVDPGPFAADVAAIRRRQDQLVAGLLATATGREADPTSPQLSALAHAVNGAVEAMARWWRDHESVSADELTEWAVGLLMPGLEQLLSGWSQRQA